MRKEQTPERIEALVKQFPFLREIVDEWTSYGETHRLHIRVERMDERLIFYKPELVSRDSGSYWVPIGSEEDLVGYGNASTDVILTHDQTRLDSTWVWGENEMCTMRSVLQPYAHRLNQVAYLVHVQNTWWHKAIPGESYRPFGELKLAERKVTIYRPPQLRKGGLKGLYEAAAFQRHAHLHTRQFIEGVCKNSPEHMDVDREIRALIEQFVTSVYNQGLRSRIDRSKSRGMSGMFGDVKLMTFVSAGRVMLTFSRKKVSVTFLTAEDGPPRMGLQGINGTFHEVWEMLTSVIELFKKDGDGLRMFYQNLKDDNKVRIG